MADFSNIIQEINTNLPDNTSQAITAAKLRTTLIDLTNQIDTVQDSFETEITENYSGLEETINNAIDGFEEEIGSFSDTLNNKVEIKLGKNLYTGKNEVTNHYIRYSDGFRAQGSGVNITDYIPVTAGISYVISSSYSYLCTSSSMAGAFYNSSKQLISGSMFYLYNNNNFTAPEGAAYVCLSYLTSRTRIQVEVGTVKTPYEPYNLIGGYLDTVYDSLDNLNGQISNKIDIKIGKNIYSGIGDKTGYYLRYSDGVITTNSSHGVTGFIEVVPGTQYVISCSNANYWVTSASMAGAFYNANKQLISGSMFYLYNNNNFTAPEGAAYVRLTYRQDRQKKQVEAGSTATSYEPYSEIGGYAAHVGDGQIVFDNFSDDVKRLFSGANGFGSFTSAGTLPANSEVVYFTNFANSTRANIIFSLIFNGAIGANGIEIGVGASASATGAAKIVVKSTSIQVGSGSYAHGLTLDNRTYVTIENDILGYEALNTGTSVDSPIATLKVTLTNGIGDTYTLSLTNRWGYGCPNLKNNNSNEIQYKFRYFPKDIQKNIWVFGDSYTEFDYRNRLSYFLWKDNCVNFMLNGHGGINAANSLTELQNLLGLGKKPTYIVWLLGQNGGNDTLSGGTYVVNSSQKTALDNFINLCNSNNIEPILATIPSVPGNLNSGGSNNPRYHNGLSNYVRSLGYRYIDMEGAVGAQPDGTWTDGLISSDGVHPSINGSIVIEKQFITDFPEIATK